MREQLKEGVGVELRGLLVQKTPKCLLLGSRREASHSNQWSKGTGVQTVLELQLVHTEE